jgi:hypothetical protein
VEKRLLWHALRHAGVQPDFLDEEQVAAGDLLKKYKVLYVTDWCVSREASAAIEEWVKAGGVLCLSAGAATRDQFFEPFTPPFAREVWPDNAAAALVDERRPYNERFDLPKLPPITKAKLAAAYGGAVLPVLGCRMPLRAGEGQRLATFADGSPAGVVMPYGRGKVFAFGFMPMLAYGQLADFKPTTLEEKWPAAPRDLVIAPIKVAGVRPVAVADRPVVETSLLTGQAGSALVLANYTYQPIRSLTVDVKLPGRVARAVSTEGSQVQLEQTAQGVRLKLPLDCTDIVVLYPESAAAR